MKTTGFPQVAALLAGLTLALGACVHDTEGEVASAEPLGASPAAVGDQAAQPGPDGWKKRGHRGGMFKHFEEADQNNDGKVTQQELQTAISAKFAAIDANKDGKVTEDELSAMRGKRKGERFAKLDANNDGAITPDEAPPRMKQHFAKADADGDGKITQAELAEGWQKKMRKGGPGKQGKMAWFDEDGDGSVSADEFSQRAFKWFERADADGDNTVTADEMKSMRKGMRGMRGKGGPGGKRGPGPMLKHLEEADANGDGRITKAEVQALKATKFAELDKNSDGVLTDDERPRRGGGDKGIRPGRMHRGDADGDGKVTKDEFIGGTDRMFERLDANGDDVITTDEIAAAKQRMGKGMRGPRGPRGQRGPEGPSR